MEICKRNRVLLSCISSYNGTLDSNMIAFINQLHCFIITLPALRDDSARIDSIVKLYLNKLNISIGKQILGITPDEMQMLCEFSWPYNYTQFTRVIENIALKVIEMCNCNQTKVAKSLKISRTTL
ncbi:hypothetical protein I6U48_07975 [Clostridium sp. PL3]|uniref:Sigma-54 factor interaction domain-containing protein n=1 Tax=Clostridium thailandense TaxID=2794346 RepID=A0A949TYH9_9CLOT|nr:hypothetical protein [Clostridium thailandense]MBV7272849.1 hypothetical protein [Clostridium thailandense]